MSHSATSFIKTLKDPATGSLLKLQLAGQIWDDNTFYIPGKPRAIIEWLLADLSKDNKPLCAEYWELLARILEEVGTPLPQWLTTTLFKSPFISIVEKALQTASKPGTAVVIDEQFIFCVNRLWASASRKSSLDTLADVFFTCIHVAAEFERMHSHEIDASCVRRSLDSVAILISDTLKGAAIVSGTAKKARQSLLEQHLWEWIICSWPQKEKHEQLPTALAIRSSGLELLFHSEVLKRPVGEHLQCLHTFMSSCHDQPHAMLAKLEAVPAMFSHYVHTLGRHRNYLIPTGKQAVHDFRVQLLVAADMYVRSVVEMCREDDSPLAWKTRASLFRILREETVYDSDTFLSTDLVISQVEQYLKGCAGNARPVNPVSNLVQSPVRRGEVVAECLVELWKLDHSRLLGSLSLILPALAEIESGDNHYIPIFLELWLEHCIKTRTLPEMVDVLIATIHGLVFTHNDVHATVRSILAGSVFTTFQSSMLPSLERFLTPTQSVPLAKLLCDACRSLYDRLHFLQSEGLTTNHQEATGWLALRFYLLCRLSTDVVRALPLVRISAVNREEIFGAVRSLFLGFECINLREIEVETWPVQIAIASIYRWYNFTFGLESLVLPEDAVCAGKPPNAIQLSVGSLHNEELIQEWGLYVIKNFARNTRNALSFEALLGFLRARIAPDDGDKPQGYTLVLVLWHDLLLCHLPKLDNVLSPSSIGHIVELLLELASGADRRLHTTIWSFLSSSETWELTNFRDTMLRYLMENLHKLEHLVSRYASNKERSSYVPNLRLAATCFGVLSQVPDTCLSRAHCAEIVRIAIHVEKELARSKTDTVHRILQPHIRGLLSLPTFANSIASTTSVDDLKSYLSLISSASSASNEDPALSETACYVGRSIFHQVTAASQSAVVPVFAELCISFAAKIRFDGDAKQNLLVIRELHGLLDEFATSGCQLSPSHKARIEAAVRAIMSNLQDPCEISGGPAKNVDWFEVVEDYCAAADLCHAAFRCCGHLDIVNAIDVDHLQRLMTNAAPFIYNAASALQRRWCCALWKTGFMPGSLHALSRVLAATVLVMRDSGDISEVMEPLLSSINETQLRHLLGFLNEFLEDPVFFGKHGSNLLRISTVICRIRNEASASLVNAHAQATLRRISYDILSGRSNIDTMAYLGWLNDICMDRNISIRTAGIGNIWACLSRLLRPVAYSNNIHTGSTIFLRIIDVVSSIIRFRREVVTSTIPQLVALLRELVFLFGTPRSHLGAAQRRFVRSKLPLWLSPEHPLGPDDARALGRLLTSLTTKQTSRLRGGGAVESLGRQLSMHAAFVLASYARLVNDPLMMLSRSIQRELEPGLFALCGISSTHARDAVMAGYTGAGEKGTLKELWHAFERQKYVGRG